MKKLFLFSVSTFLFLSCGSSEPFNEGITPPSTNASDFSKCMINNIKYENNTSLASLQSKYYPSNNEAYIYLEMKEVGSQTPKRGALSFYLVNFSGKKKYDIKMTDYNVNFSSATLDVANATGDGSVEVIEYVSKKYITGKFQFVVTKDNATFKIEDGEFRIKVDY